MSKIKIEIDYDTETQEADVWVCGIPEKWRDAKMIISSGIIESQEGDLIIRKSDGTVSLSIKGVRP